MDNTRLQRLDAEIQKELTSIITNDLKDPRVKGLISVLRVETTNDLRHAKIYISIFNADKNKTQVFNTLTKASGYFRSELSKRLIIRTVPEIHFVLDESIEYSAKIEEILKQIEKTKPKDEA